jgi:hypothetical protein
MRQREALPDRKMVRVYRDVRPIGLTPKKYPRYVAGAKAVDEDRHAQPLLD